MKPELPRTLQGLAGTLLAELAPRLADDYAQKNAAVVAGLLLVAAEEWDRAAERRVAEHAALRRLFAEAAPRVANAPLRERLEEAARGRDPGLRIALLEQENARLRGLLVELHEHVEGRSDAAARALEERVWSELRAEVERRAIGFWPL
jgi:hypothetical protein